MSKLSMHLIRVISGRKWKMVKALLALAKIWPDFPAWFNHLGRDCVANPTHMLQTSSFNPTHVLVASNRISLFCSEGRIYIITLLKSLPVLIILLNPLLVLVALKILQEILSFTDSFMINTHLLVGCLENCIWCCNTTPDLYHKIVTQHTSR